MFFNYDIIQETSEQFPKHFLNKAIMKHIVHFLAGILLLLFTGACDLIQTDEDIYQTYVGIWQGVYMENYTIDGNFVLEITSVHTYLLDHSRGGKHVKSYEGTATYNDEHLVFEGDINESFETMGSVEESEITLTGENIQLYNMYR